MASVNSPCHESGGNRVRQPVPKDKEEVTHTGPLVGRVATHPTRGRLMLGIGIAGPI